MNKNELYLKTAFCCIACDGCIAEEELSLVNSFVHESEYFNGINAEDIINQYIKEINEQGKYFLARYLDDIVELNLSLTDEIKLAEIAIKMIEADNNIEYSEISFFKEIRKRLSFSDAQFISAFPNKEDYILPDIEPIIEPSISFNFSSINFD